MVTSHSGHSGWQPFYYQSPQVITAFDIHYLIAGLGQFALMGHEVHQVHAPVQTPNGLLQANVTGLNAMKNTCVCKCPSTPATCLPPIRSNCHLIIYHLHHSGPAMNWDRWLRPGRTGRESPLAASSRLPIPHLPHAGLSFEVAPEANSTSTETLQSSRSNGSWLRL